VDIGKENDIPSTHGMTACSAIDFVVFKRHLPTNATYTKALLSRQQYKLIKSNKAK